jgi:hypothetical protein
MWISVDKPVFIYPVSAAVDKPGLNHQLTHKLSTVIPSALPLFGQPVKKKVDR